MRTFKVLLLALLLLGFGSAAKADQIQIGELTTSFTILSPFSPGFFDAKGSLTNSTDIPLQLATLDFTNGVHFDNPSVWIPGMTALLYESSGAIGADSVTVAGTLTSLVFSVNGVTYAAMENSWSVTSFVVSNSTTPIFVDAKPTVATPEPASLALLLAGALGAGALRRRKA